MDFIVFLIILIGQGLSAILLYRARSLPQKPLILLVFFSVMSLVILLKNSELMSESLFENGFNLQIAILSIIGFSLFLNDKSFSTELSKSSHPIFIVYAAVGVMVLHDLRALVGFILIQFITNTWIRMSEKQLRKYFDCKFWDQISSFLAFTLGFSLFVKLHGHQHDIQTFNLSEIVAQYSRQSSQHVLTLFAISLCLLAIMKSSPIFPFHWIDSQKMLKQGLGRRYVWLSLQPALYLFIRFVLPFIHAESAGLRSFLIAFLLLGAIYLVVQCLFINELAAIYLRLVGISSSLLLSTLISNPSLDSIDRSFLFSVNQICLFAFGYSIAALEQRFGPISLRSFLGIGKSMPTLAFAYLFFAGSLIGFPGAVSFIRDEIFLEAHSGVVWHLIIVAVILALMGIALFRTYAKVFLGPQKLGFALGDMIPRERQSVFVMIVILVGMSLIPKDGLRSSGEAHREIYGREEIQR